MATRRTQSYGIELFTLKMRFCRWQKTRREAIRAANRENGTGADFKKVEKESYSAHEIVSSPRQVGVCFSPE